MRVLARKLRFVQADPLDLPLRAGAGGVPFAFGDLCRGLG